MADDNKQPADNFASNVVIVALLLVTGTAVYFQPAPLQGARPAVTETAIRQNAKENIDARLWQDPFGAIAKWHREQLAADKKLGGKQKHCTDRQCESPLSRAPTGETLVLAVTVSGSPYAESEEGRRRARYAVVSALRVTGFMPASAEHIGYWRPVDCQPADNQQSQQHQASNEKPQQPRHTRIAAHKNSGKSVAIPTAAQRQYAELRGGPANGGNAINENGSCSSEDPLWADSAVPYEWFYGSERNGSERNVLLLWINEDGLGDKPIDALFQLVERLDRKDPAAEFPRHTFKVKILRTRVLGHASRHGR